MRKVVSLSLDGAIHTQLQRAARSEGMTLSQYARKLFTGNGAAARNTGESLHPNTLLALAEATDVTVIASCIIMYDSKVLVVKRRGKEGRVPRLTWSFPGGTIEQLTLAANAKSIISDRCGLDVAMQPIAARSIPDVPSGQPPVFAVYFAGEAITQQVRLSPRYTDARWIEPNTIFSYFTTSICDDVVRYLLAGGPVAKC